MLTGMLELLFGKAEEINGGERCPTYLFRWTVIKGRDWAVYLHHFVGDDWSRDLHDHPKRFISIGLWGSYVEWTASQRDMFRVSEGEPEPGFVRKWRAPWIRSFPAEHIHRLETPSGSCWTLVIVLKRQREWGFWHKGRFIHWRSYVKGADSAIADKMKACD